jgi:hypothetical protein
MNILQKIHERWEANEQLRDLIPVDHFFTGRVPGVYRDFVSSSAGYTDISPLEIALPYASVRLMDAPLSRRSNGARAHAYGIRFQIWTTTLADGLLAHRLLSDPNATYGFAGWGQVELDNDYYLEYMDLDTANLPLEEPQADPTELVFQTTLEFTAWIGKGKS